MADQARTTEVEVQAGKAKDRKTREGAVRAVVHKKNSLMG